MLRAVRLAVDTGEKKRIDRSAAEGLGARPRIRREKAGEGGKGSIPSRGSIKFCTYPRLVAQRGSAVC